MHVNGAMWQIFTTVEGRISSRAKWYKNYKNRLRSAKVIVKKMSRFYGSVSIFRYTSGETDTPESLRRADRNIPTPPASEEKQQFSETMTNTTVAHTIFRSYQENVRTCFGLSCRRFKAKFHYASWSGVGSNRFEAGRRQVRSCSATSFEPASN